MELEILVAIAIGLLTILLIVLAKLKSAPPAAAVNQEPAANDGAQNRRIPRRAVVARNARNRLQAPVVRNSDSEHEAEVDSENELANEKLGAKKRAKLEAKAERQKMREAEERSREDRRKQREIEDEERVKEQEKEKKEELKREAEEKRALAEKEAKEQEEYEKMKAMFSVEDEGCEVAEEEEQRNLLQEFVEYIKNTKVVVLEDLAAHFHLKTQNAIDRIHDLQAEGRLTGVLDDRGKFIYVSQSELEEVAKFVKQRGRVSRIDLAESSNRLINLKSVQSA